MSVAHRSRTTGDWHLLWPLDDPGRFVAPETQAASSQESEDYDSVDDSAAVSDFDIPGAPVIESPGIQSDSVEPSSSDSLMLLFILGAVLLMGLLWLLWGRH